MESIFCDILTSNKGFTQTGTYQFSTQVNAIFISLGGIQGSKQAQIDITKAIFQSKYSLVIIISKSTSVKLFIAEIVKNYILLDQFAITNNPKDSLTKTYRKTYNYQGQTTYFQGALSSFKYIQNQTCVLFGYRMDYLESTNISFNLYNPVNFFHLKYNFMFIKKQNTVQGGQFYANRFYTNSNLSSARVQSTYHLVTSVYELRYNHSADISIFFWQLYLVRSLSIYFSSFLTSTSYKVLTLQLSMLTCKPLYYHISLSQCVTTCPSGTAPQQMFCLPCQVNCDICSSTTICITCNYRSYLMNYDCLCLQGFFRLQNQYCEICAPNCLACTAYLVCLQCNDKSSLDKGKCECSAGSLATIQSVCEFCLSSCRLCYSYETCLECQDNAVLQPDGNCLPVISTRYQVAFRNKSIQVSTQENVDLAGIELKVECLDCETINMLQHTGSKSIRVTLLANKQRQTFRVSAPGIQRGALRVQPLSSELQTYFDSVVVNPTFKCGQMMSTIQNLTCSFNFGSKASLVSVSRQRFQIRYRILPNIQLSNTIEVSIAINQSCYDYQVAISIPNSAIVLSPPAFLQQNTFSITVSMVLYTLEQIAMLKQVSFVSERYLYIIVIILSLLNVLGLLRSLQLMFAVTTFLKIMEPLSNQFPLNFRLYLGSISALQNLLLPQIIATKVAQVVGPEDGQIWLACFFLPVLSALIFGLLLNFFIRIIKLRFRKRNIFKYLQENIEEYLASSSGFAYSSLLLVRKGSPLLLVLNTLCGIWLFSIFYLFINNYERAKPAKKLLHVAKLSVQAISFTTGALVLVVDSLIAYSVLIFSFSLVKLLLKRTLKFQRKVGDIGELLLAISFVVSCFVARHKQAHLALGFVLLAIVLLVSSANTIIVAKSLMSCWNWVGCLRRRFPRKTNKNSIRNRIKYIYSYGLILGIKTK